MIGGQRQLIIKKAIREYVDHADGPVRPGTSEYADLMMNVEGQVQTVLEELGEIDP